MKFAMAMMFGVLGTMNLVGVAQGILFCWPGAALTFYASGFYTAAGIVEQEEKANASK